MAEKKQLKILDELRTLDEAALIQKAAELSTQLVDQQRAHAAQELPSASVIGKTRKDRARTLTVLTQVRAQAKSAKKEEEK